MKRIFTYAGFMAGLLIMGGSAALANAQPAPATGNYLLEGRPRSLVAFERLGELDSRRTLSKIRPDREATVDHEIIADFLGEENRIAPGTTGPEPIGVDVSVCGYKTATLRATYGPSLPAGGSFQWYAFSAGSYTPIPANSNTPTESTLDVPAPSGNLPQLITYYVTITYEDAGQPAESSRHAVTATFNPLTVLDVTAEKLCPGTVTTVNLSVNNPATSTTDYYWFDNTTQTTSPYPAGPTFSPTVSAPTTYYVQAVPKSGSTDCPSALTPVAIEYHHTTQPDVFVPVAVVKGSALNVSIQKGDPSYTYTWEWHDQPATVPSVGMTTSHVYQTVGGYDVQLTLRDTNAPTACSFTTYYHVEVGDNLCNAVLPATNLSTLKVRLSKRNGSFLFIPTTTTCPAINSTFACLTGQPGAGSADNLAVASSAVSLADLPPTADPAYALSATDLTTNPFLAGAGRLRPEATYTYATPVIDTYAYSTERGRFQVVPFNWQVSSAYHLPAWRRGGQATRYSPDGQALEEQDILHVFSAVKLGYQGHSLPYLTAKNAQYQQVLFEGFEHLNPLQGEDSFIISPDEAQGDIARAHSGNQCLLLNALGEGAREHHLTLPTFTSLTGEVQLRLWLRVSDNGKDDYAFDKVRIIGQGFFLQVRWTNTLTTAMKVVAQTGEWMLCETSINLGMPDKGVITVSPVFIISGTPQQWQVRVDDVRLQPLAAQMSCYVYDWKTLKLLTSFDDQHFGLYYQYNAEGKLVRKQVETERGLMTIQETQYNLPRP